jgi:DNA-3-methyladenine glycosylase II
VAEVTVKPAAPYSLALTVGAYARFPDESVDVVVPGGYRRLFDVNGHLVLVEASQQDSGHRVTLRALNSDSVPADAVRAALVHVRRMLSIDEPIKAVRDLVNDHPRLSVLDNPLRGLRRTLDPTPFEGLVSSILAQLISIRGAAAVRARLVQRFGQSLEHEGRVYWSFPEPERVVESSVDELCGSIRMTSAKARSILAVAESALGGDLDYGRLDRMEDRDLTKYLITLPGIGPWTAEWFLVNVMGRMSVVPVGDLGIRRSTGHWFLDGEMPSQQQVREIYEPFGDPRAYVAYYVLSAERYRLQAPA